MDPMAKKDVVDINEYVLIKKSLLNDWAATVQELNKTLLWLKAERERLVFENDELIRSSKEMDASARKLVALFKEVKAENERLTNAIIDRMPKIKPGAAS